MTCEKWRPIRGFEGYFEVSDQGRVRSVQGARVRRYPNMPRLLKTREVGAGYLAVGLIVRGHPRGPATRYVHRVVWEAFNDVIPREMEINHLNGNKHDCRLENLQLVTHAENMRHAVAAGLVRVLAPGTANGTAVLDESRVKAMLNDLARGVTGVACARKYGVSPQTVSEIRRNRIWKHVPRPEV